MRAHALILAGAIMGIAPVAVAQPAAPPEPMPPAIAPTPTPPVPEAPAETADDHAAGGAALREQARARSELGRRHYELGDYRAAITAYRDAYLLLPSPGVLFNLGQAYRHAGNCAAAARAYQSFLRSEPTGPARQLAKEQLPVVEGCARDATAASIRRDRRLRTGGAITGVLGLAALGAATYYALDARSAEDEVERFYRGGGRWSDIAEADERGRRSSGLALGLAIGGGVAVTTGAVLYMLGTRREARERERAVWVAPTRTAAVVGASWAF